MERLLAQIYWQPLTRTLQQWHCAGAMRSHLLPSVFWVGAVLNLIPDSPNGLLNRGVPALGVLLFLLAMVNPTLHTLALFITVILALSAVVIVARHFRTELPQRPIVTALTANLFFVLGVGLLLMPTGWLPISETLLLIAIGGDLLMLGAAVGLMDAYDEGQALWRDALRSLAEVGVVGALLGGTGRDRNDH